MTDRDHFAAAALTGLLVNANSDIDEETMDTPSDIAYTAYAMADAMLRERANHPAIPDSCPASTPQVTRKPVADRLAEWERLGSHRWGLGVAIDLYDLECRVAALEKDHIPDAGKMVATPGEWRAPNGCHPTAVWHELLRTKESIKDIADDVCGVGSGVTVNSPLAADWLDAIAAEYHRVRIALEQLRAKTIHDAAPAARAVSDEDRTDKAATSHRRDRSGNTPDRPQPINAARLAALEELSALDQALELEYGLTGNPMIKAQQHTPQTQPTPGEGSVPREGT